MLFITTWRIKDGVRDKADITKLMESFGASPESPGQIASYVYADGSGGVIVAEYTGDDTANYRRSLEFGQWLDIDSKVALDVNDAAPVILEWLGS